MSNVVGSAAKRGQCMPGTVSGIAAFLNQVNPNRARPVRLQVNSSGAWRDVIRFDASMDVKSAEVMGAAETLGLVSRCSFRIVIDEPGRSPTVLTTWAVDTGWKDR